MCGIAGQVRFDGQAVEPQLLAAMNQALVHRGPDSDGVYCAGGAGLVFRRLAIIDLSAAGSQPMTSESGRLRLVFNGEIYNHESLRAGLLERGHTFHSRTDTETILHRYEEVGPRLVHELRGMFALALWDPDSKRLLLARDRLGKKPLYYHVSRDKITFASEMAALLCDPTIRRSVDPQALDTYLTYQYLPGDTCMIPGVKKLPPAHWATFSPEGLHIEKYWELHFEPKVLIADEKELAGELLERLSEAVRLRMIADVPLGAFLSGGVDSSAIVALMSRHSPQPVKTFSIGFAEEDYSELPYAKQVAKLYGTDHHEYIVTPDAIEILPLLVRHYGDPYADSSAIATYYVARETRRSVTVALNGDGGDENFAGYDRYLAHRMVSLYRRIPAPIRHLINGVLDFLPEPTAAFSQLRRIKRFASVGTAGESDGYLPLVVNLDRSFRERLYTDSMRGVLKSHDSGRILRDILATSDARADVDRAMAMDIHTNLPDDLLAKVDIATMANSLEGRSPFLDHVFMEFAAKIPAEYKLRGRTTKYILKKALEPLLPKEILYRRKMGFGVPIKKWFRKELAGYVRSVLLDPKALSRGYFERAPMETLIHEHVSGQRDQAYRLYTLLMLELWHREFIDRGNFSTYIEGA